MPMKIAQILLKNIPADISIPSRLEELSAIDPQLLLIFGCVRHLTDPLFAESINRVFPSLAKIGCTTAGEINRDGVHDETTVITALHFENSRFQIATAQLANMDASFYAGQTLGAGLSREGLRAVMLLGQGVNINGSALIDGVVSILGQSIPVTGGLAADGGAFSRTYTFSPAGVSSDAVIAIGFYGEKLFFSHGSYGGWKAFGPIRKITRCANNILYELDGKPALEIYRRYLGEYAKDLPGSGLLFPFEMLTDMRESSGSIRTILGINETDGSLILAGEINPEGYLRLMHAHTNDLVDGAEIAAQAVRNNHEMRQGQALAILVSCIGRKLVMGGRVEEEAEIVGEILGNDTVLCGFYSNGEICPGHQLHACSLHNQTMTITYLAENR